MSEWIEIKEGCKLPSMFTADDVQIVVDGGVTCGYYVYPVQRSWGGSIGGGWMEYTLKGTAECSPSHWQPMANPPSATHTAIGNSEKTERVGK